MDEANLETGIGSTVFAMNQISLKQNASEPSRGFRIACQPLGTYCSRPHRGERGKDSMRVAHFIQRYPPALGGSEAFFARLSNYLVSAGDRVTVATTNA